MNRDSQISEIKVMYIDAADGGLGKDLKSFGLLDHHLFDSVKLPVRQWWKQTSTACTSRA